MPTLRCYLLFTGTCAEAMTFYHACLGGTLTMTRVGESPAKDYFPAPFHDKIIHAELISGPMMLTASDWLRPGQTPVIGNTVCLYVQSDSVAELRELFDKLSPNATLVEPLAAHMAGSYGALTDAFGIRWMFHTTQRSTD